MANFKANNGLRAISIYTKDSIRKLTPLECMRLQTVPDDYLMPVSNTRKYMLLGNGWTVDVICHILKNMDLKEGQSSK
jgi:DNA (cytosine-5)-methyltransferase 3A